ncbi:MAG TPA: bifunctional hydroxymethylpyrimidine kinase/phosphomethylpyrimidine kinase, partial [Deltaproteobacteria bacterium]|nr:bifunctional hydroxymethylpyrimidine kinase/phosphomethylpyrimidine kinase [Deltaproteobacteria bacterium]
RLLVDRDPRPPIVVDPVMVASTGHRLLDPQAERVLAEELLPLATLVTPNLDEAEALAAAQGAPGAEAWAAGCAVAVLLTGGDRIDATADTSEQITDVLFLPTTRGSKPARRWTHPHQGARPFHGTGCTLSSAIAAHLALGHPLQQAVDGGIRYVQRLIGATMRRGSVGGGNPPLLHGVAELRGPGAP